MLEWMLRHSRSLALTFAGVVLLSASAGKQEVAAGRNPVLQQRSPDIQVKALLPGGNAPQAPAPSTSGEPPGVTVVLDPAHGGADFGSRGPTGLAESDVVLDFARAARIALEAQRLRVLLTREGNQDPGFDNRSAIINGLRNAVFVSLHVSSSGPVGTARTYYYVFPSDAAPAVTPTASATAAPSATPSGQTASAQPG